MWKASCLIGVILIYSFVDVDWVDLSSCCFVDIHWIHWWLDVRHIQHIYVYTIWLVIRHSHFLQHCLIQFSIDSQFFMSQVKPKPILEFYRLYSSQTVLVAWSLHERFQNQFFGNPETNQSPIFFRNSLIGLGYIGPLLVGSALNVVFPQPAIAPQQLRHSPWIIAYWFPLSLPPWYRRTIPPPPSLFQPWN